MKTDHTSQAKSHNETAGAVGRAVAASNKTTSDKRKRLTASNIGTFMTPGVRYTCVALANRLNSNKRQVRASLTQLVDTGVIRHVQESRTGIYWIPTLEEKSELGRARRDRGKPLSHTLEGYDSELRRIQTLCMLVRRS
ncbi:MAG TPA: hypothetical protein VF573_07350 [Paraburkholderia sp.]|uniref:hypothetical protein n=1 Tax=Paraburkholderia sp. TaxID=1926495 RepID=UPI002ED28197